MAKTIARMEESRCTCNMGSAFVGVLLCAAAIFFVIKGWMMQTVGNEGWIMIYLWYLVGVVLGVAGHVFKKKGLCCKHCGTA